MTKLQEQIMATLPPGMTVPDELSLLFDWIEDNKYYIDRDGTRVGHLYPFDRLLEQWEDDERQGGTYIEFFAEGNVNMKYWLGHERPEVIERICVFAKTGGDGSMAAFWLDDNGAQKIVHLGSGSGSTLVCVLAESPLEFLRLLAIGYDEICWNEDYSRTPAEAAEENGMLVHPNTEFQSWLTNTFAVSVPARADQIVRHPAEMGDVDSADEFCRWVENHTS